MSPAAERGDSAEGRRRGGKASQTKGGKSAKGSRDVAAKKADARTGRLAARPRIRLDRLRSGEAIALAAAMLLFVLMFLDWYGTKATTAGEPLGGVITGAAGGNAWQTLEVIPLFLMLAIVVAVGAALLRISGSDWKPAIPPAAAVTVLGILAAILILIRIVSPPGPSGAFSELGMESTLKLPVFLALAAALGIAYGGWRGMGQEGSSFAGIAKRLESTRPARAKSTAAPKSSGRAKS
jgi:hypothetical protein